MSNTTKHKFETYEVFSDGRVISIPGWRGQCNRELHQIIKPDGYPVVRLTVNGKRKAWKVHSLIAACFLPAAPNGNCEIRHLDGNKLNNAVSNLAWGTPKENAEDREKHGNTSRGRTHAVAVKRAIEQSKLNREIIAIVTTLQERGLTAAKILSRCNAHDELVEALEAVSKELDTWHNWQLTVNDKYPKSKGAAKTRDVLVAANAALAKARGSSSGGK